MKVHCIEGIANHNVPESCAVTREGGGEALTGVRIGQPLSRENDFLFRTPTRSLTWKATQTEASTQASVWTAWSETLACAHALRKGTGRSWVWPVIASPVRNGKLHCWSASHSISPRRLPHAPMSSIRSGSTVIASRIRTGMRRSGRLEKSIGKCEGCVNVLVTLKVTADCGSESGSRRAMTAGNLRAWKT